MPKLHEIPGVNIQWPWSALILSGEKTVETRSYPIPEKHLGKPLAIIETPGSKGAKAGIKKARVTGIVVFEKSILYPDEESWSEDKVRHKVEPGDPTFGFDKNKPKWGWVVKSITPFDTPLPPPQKRGIVFASSCVIPDSHFPCPH